MILVDLFRDGIPVLMSTCPDEIDNEMTEYSSQQDTWNILNIHHDINNYQTSISP